MPKVTTTHVSHAGTSNTTRVNVNSDRGGPVPAQQPVAEPAPVAHIPFRQHKHADGTVTAPSWSPEDVDANLSGPSQWNRSWEDTQAHLNPAGDPIHRRQHNQPADLPAEQFTTVSFSGGKKTVHQPERDTLPVKPASVLLAKPSRLSVVRKVVGSLKPASMTSVSEGE
jgi:hypothetical protein